MSVASKNLYALLGNDDGDETPRAPVKTVEKTTTRTTKRNVEPEAPSRLPPGGGSARRAPGSGNDAAFRDRNAGSDRNRTRGTEENARGGNRGGYGARGRGGRGGRFPRERDDRHPHKASVGTNSEKQAAHGWGATEGNAELKDEQAGEAIAEGEKKEAAAEGEATEAVEEKVEEEEPEDKNISYTDYLAQQAEKKAALEAELSIRKPNEGSSGNKKWDSAQELQREEEDYIGGSSSKAKRERERKQKQVVEIDQRYVEPERSERSDRPARGGPRGGARGGQRGGPRGGQRGGPRGGAAPRGGPAPRGDGNQQRGGRRDNAASINTKDESAFPSLGK